MAKDEFLDSKKEIFERTVNLIKNNINTERERFGTSFLEALMVGVSDNIDFLESLESRDIQRRFDLLKLEQSLTTEYLSGGVSKREKVEARIEASKRIFSEP